jgi:hypothetical protein
MCLICLQSFSFYSLMQVKYSTHSIFREYSANYKEAQFNRGLIKKNVHPQTNSSANARLKECEKTILQLIGHYIFHW